MSYLTEYRRFLTHPSVSEEDRAALARMEGDEEAIRAAFSGSLSFGTAGLRGIMAPGTAMMNRNTVMQAGAGLAAYILSRGGGERGCVIAHDSRNRSSLFARSTAAVMTAMGVKCYLFDGMRPTPLLSFSIRDLGCIAGINITASHNPKEYNGFKAYWEDGAQLSPEQAEAVSDCIAAIDVLDGVPSVDPDAMIESGAILPVPAETEERYLRAVLAQSVDPSLLRTHADMRIVYTPLHGAGRDFVPRVLSMAGLRTVLTVPEQNEPDGDFPSVRYPNPEFPEVFAPGIAIAEENGCDLIIATDPDADRVGVMARDERGVFRALSGNQTGALLLSYIITSLKERNALPEDAYAVKSIVTTELASRICRAEGVEMVNVLTGFKFIGEVIKNREAEGCYGFLLGFEESYGYLKGTYARDKDAVVASLLIAEMAAYYSERGMTLPMALDALYKRYGYAAEQVVSITVQGADGKERMKALTASLRQNPPTHLGGERVVRAADYLTGRITAEDGSVLPTSLPTSDVLYFVTESGSCFIVRPSGTEPKIKLYLMAFGASEEEAKARCEALSKEAKGLC